MLLLRAGGVGASLERPLASLAVGRHASQAVPVEGFGVVELLGRGYGLSEPLLQIGAGDLFGGRAKFVRGVTAGAGVALVGEPYDVVEALSAAGHATDSRVEQEAEDLALVVVA